MGYSTAQMQKLIEDKVNRHYGCGAAEATKQQMYRSVCSVVRDIMNKNKIAFDKQIKKQEAKKVYYMSMEFLVGPSLKNNLYKLRITDIMERAVKEFGFDLKELIALDPDAGLGNGGLGRLASCYMDAASTENYSFTGYSLRYEFGIFRQKIVDGWQMEFPDNWLDFGDSWLRARPDDAVEVNFDGYVSEHWEDGQMIVKYHDTNTVLAVPHDMLIPGYDTKATNPLVLWSAKSTDRLDLNQFSRGEFLRSMESNTMAESITRVLYPADDHWKGKELRLKQQYLLVCASVHSIIKEFMGQYGDITKLSDKVAIHINDTHPSLCVPELMRVLMDEYHLDWDTAWEITGKTLAYTNHTVMSEALEKWPEALFSQKLPRIYSIVREIDRRYTERISAFYPNDFGKINYMKIIEGGNVKMANLCLACCHMTNGVSKLHSDILKDDLFHDFYMMDNDHFGNVTNGIDYRRWLCVSNPELTKLLCSTIGRDFIKDASQLEKFMAYHDDSAVLAQLRKIKYNNKVRLAEYIAKANGVKVDPASLFDIQVKRLHEYKRQLLNVMNIIDMYLSIKDNPQMEVTPRTFIFGAKASAGYQMAKQIIRLINVIAKQINNDPDCFGKMKVIFIEDYKVSLAEIIIPAADISEQISVAGKEASGTGNMKFMLNGAITLGTMDGANVEIHEQVGDDNIFIFGMSAEEVVALWRKGYDPKATANANADIRRVLDYMMSGIRGISFADIVYSLTEGQYGKADAYMTIADFASYKEMQQHVAEVYRDEKTFSQMSLVNIAKSGIFAADRCINEYAENIWNIEKVLTK